MARNYVFAPGEYYHVYSRGFDKNETFREKGDYNRFLEATYLCNSRDSVHMSNAKKAMKSQEIDSIFEYETGENLVGIGAYCLMKNHFHFLLREIDDEGKGISKFMQKLMTSYTMYFNKKYERTGALFGTSFKAKHVTNDNHLKHLFAYIHLNPKDIVGLGQVQAYPYSSYAAYVNKNSNAQYVLQKDLFPDYFKNCSPQEVHEWILLQDEI